MNLDRSFGPFDPPRTHFVDILRYWAEAQPDGTAFIFTDGESNESRISYGELWKEVRGLAGYLQRYSVRRERVLLFYPPGLEYVIGFFACHAAGAVAVPAFPPRRNRKVTRIRSIARNAGAQLALATCSVAEQLTMSSDHYEDLAGVKLLGTDSPSCRDISAWRDPKLSPRDLAMLQYTSGSTGSPKGVMLTQENLVRNCELILYAFESTPDGMGLTWLPLYHDMGLVGGVLEPLFYGRPNVLMSPMTFLQRPARWLQTISRYGVTISGGPNFSYQLCVDKITPDEMEGVSLKSWLTAFNGAEPVRAHTLKAFAERFGPYGFRPEAYLPCYGMAEATLIVTGGPRGTAPIEVAFDGRLLDDGRVRTINSGDSSARTLVGSGKVLPGETILIVDPDTRQVLGPEQVGEIWISGPSVGEGYWEDAEKTAAVFKGMTVDGRGPMLRTGDLGFLHQGQLFVTGRLKDMIIIRGVNRYPQDIELTVEQASTVIQTGGVAAMAMEHEGREQLVIVAEAGRRKDVDWDSEMRRIRRAVTEQHELPPDAIFLVRPSSVPKTSSGKIQRHACLAAVREGELRELAKWVRWELSDEQEHALTNEVVVDSAPTANDPRPLDPQVLEVVYQQIRAIARERAGQLNEDTNIVLDLGLDSLERLQIAHGLEQAFGGRFPETVLQEIETVRQITLAIQHNMAGAKPQTVTEVVVQEPAERLVRPEDYRFDLLPEYLRLKATADQLMSTGLGNPYFTVHQGLTRDTTVVNGRELISFASYNYLGMSGDPQVSTAAKQAVDRYGTSVSASRLVSGEKPIHRELERGIANFLGVSDALCFVGGHSTNETTIGHLVGPGDLILHDALAHNSIVQGALLSGARRRPFPHNDWQALDAILSEVRTRYRRVLVIIEGVYSMDGDYPDLPEFVRVKDRHRSWLMVDEAHSIGTMGSTGRGISEHFEIDPRKVDIWMATLSKSFGSCGGYIAGQCELIEYLRYTTPGFLFSVGMPPPAAAAAAASLQVMQSDPQRISRLQQRGRLFLSLAQQRGLDTGSAMPGTPIIPVITGNSIAALKLSHHMMDHGVNVQPILYPAVEESAARLRFFMTSEHTEEQIRKTVDIAAEGLAQLGYALPTERRPVVARIK